MSDQKQWACNRPKGHTGNCGKHPILSGFDHLSCGKVNTGSKFINKSLTIGDKFLIICIQIFVGCFISALGIALCWGFGLFHRLFH